ncbi:protease SohB [Candidatus Thiodictyon syntrophicum]|jgi:serine protease SohB|uniref:Protease SohB n=1 Tax=Candidatus Thiodictyon syntrophicum TaxID=1166950 RepID=A0A2K8UFY6_9GAMM|nr:protease SohB [Candidatus Thiodictyon syntrophicum]AUB84399.1 protease SohB [Candidatus Thiodictyon syntrophicum]
MMDLLLDYALFLAKTLTVLVATVLAVVFAMRARHAGGGSDDGERLEILDLNERYRSLARALKETCLTKKDFRAYVKAEHKREKARAKAQTEERKRLFVIDFSGDIRATEVAALRVLVTTILLDAKAGDAVLVRVENAGGTVHEHGLAASQLARLRARGVHLTVAVDKIAASGGYLMACVADRIVAAPFAVLGSIGVLAELPNFHRLLERHGVDFELQTAGQYKRTLTLFGENTDAARQKLQEQLEETHNLFKGFVHEYRPALDLELVATGEYWHGNRAVELGLVDAIQTSDDLLLTESEHRDLLQLKYTAKKKPIERLLASLQGALAGRLAAWAGRLAQSPR